MIAMGWDARSCCGSSSSDVFTEIRWKAMGRELRLQYPEYFFAMAEALAVLIAEESDGTTPEEYTHRV